MKKFKLFSVLAIALALVLSSFKSADNLCPDGWKFALYQSGSPNDVGSYLIIDNPEVSPCPIGSTLLCGFCVPVEFTDGEELTDFPGETDPQTYPDIEAEIAAYIADVTHTSPTNYPNLILYDE
jgi:hypothetical protein